MTALWYVCTLKSEFMSNENLVRNHNQKLEEMCLMIFMDDSFYNIKYLCTKDGKPQRDCLTSLINISSSKCYVRNSISIT